MAWPAIVTAGLITGGASLLGGILGNKSASSSQEKSNAVQSANVDKQITYQKEFAQKGIQWRSKDAKKAGISPLAALGAQTTSYQPQSIFPVSRETGHMGKAVANMGQDVSRSILANASKQDRMVQSAILVEQLKAAKLANIGQELKNINASNPQGFPTTGDPISDSMNQQGQGNAGNNTNTSGVSSVEVVPDKIIASKQTGVSAGTSPLRKHYVDELGWVWNINQQEAGEALESDNVGQMKMMVHGAHRWFAGRNRNIKPKISVPKGYKLLYSRSMNQWRIVKDKGLKRWDRKWN